MKQHHKLAKYLRGTAKALTALANEIEKARGFDKESEELLSKIGANLLFEAKVYTFRDLPPPHPPSSSKGEISDEREECLGVPGCSCHDKV